MVELDLNPVLALPDGCLAVDAHGAALPAEGEAHVPGQTFGSLSNLVTSLTAVVWNGSEYALKTYARSDAAIKPLLTHLGRTFLTSVTLQAAPNYRMRCVSHTDIGQPPLPVIACTAVM